MEKGETECIYSKDGVSLNKVMSLYHGIQYYVIGGGPTRYFEDYDDALEEYNLRWMRIEFGEEEE